MHETMGLMHYKNDNKKQDTKHVYKIVQSSFGHVLYLSRQKMNSPPTRVKISQHSLAISKIDSRIS